MVNNMLRFTKVYMKRAGVELDAPLRLTTFRKSFGRNHGDRGTAPRTSAKLMGHSGVSVTMAFYSRVTDATEQAPAATMHRVLASSGDAKKAEGAG